MKEIEIKKEKEKDKREGEEGKEDLVSMLIKENRAELQEHADLVLEYFKLEEKTVSFDEPIRRSKVTLTPENLEKSLKNLDRMISQLRLIVLSYQQLKKIKKFNPIKD